MKLCLGTVQFGLDYGIRGRRKPPVAQALALLDAAVAKGVTAIDTSALYGDAERLVGTFLRRERDMRARLFVVSKFGTSRFEGCSAEDCEAILREVADESLERLGTSYLDAFICHVPAAVRDTRILRALTSLRETGRARHVGFSVYETAEARAALETGLVDFLQVPLSVFDQRMANEGVLDLAAEKGALVHARSAFVQGLVLMQPTEVPEHLSGIRPALMQLDQICREAHISRRDLALAFVRSHQTVSHLVFGVHDQRQLDETVGSFQKSVDADVFETVRAQFGHLPSELVMPNKWRRAT